MRGRRQTLAGKPEIERVQATGAQRVDDGFRSVREHRSADGDSGVRNRPVPPSERLELRASQNRSG